MKPTSEYEGLRLQVYRDPVGIPTVGYGHNLTAPGSKEALQTLGVDHDAILRGAAKLTPTQATRLYHMDLAKAKAAATQLIPNLEQLHPKVQSALIDMAFNLGGGKLATFRNFLGQIKRGDYLEAARNVLKTKYARQVGRRAVDVSNAIASADSRTIG